jgi:cytochrome c heme-lyase
MANERHPPANGACPVDHNARAAWLKSNASAMPVLGAGNGGCDSSKLNQNSKSSSSSSSSSSLGSNSRHLTQNSLATDREVSTIPRAPISPTDTLKPANSEAETDADRKSGNWIYPSEEMFFNALRRKGYESKVEDMKTIVPIHNAVNERAWKEIKEWERHWGADAYVFRT